MSRTAKIAITLFDVSDGLTPVVGVDYQDGVSGAGFYRVGAIYSTWPNTAIANTHFEAVSGRAVVLDDVLTMYDPTSVDTNETRRWDGTGWVPAALLIDGDMIATGTIRGDRITAGTISGDRITAGTINGDRITAGTISGDKIVADTVDATKLVITGTNAVTAATVGADSSGSAAAARVAAIAASDSSGSAAAAQAAAITSASTDASAKVAVVTNNIYTTGTTTIDGGVIETGSITTDRLVVNSSSITVDGNVINISSAAINREHYFPAGSSRWVLIPYLATKFTLTGCAAGGGRLGGVNPIDSQIVSAGGGGGGGCNNFTGTLPSSSVYVIVTVGSGVVGGAGGNTVVYVATDIDDQSTFQPILILGGGGVGTLAGTRSGFPGHIYTTGGAGGTSSPVMSGRIANGGTGSVGSSAGGEAMTGTGSTITDWVYGSSGPYLTNVSTGGEPLGNGCGAGGGSGLSHSLNGTFKNALAGGPGFMNVSFGT